ncbi:uncharacterized protein GGS25DRAFT_518486 [Hypoxylon fragiforme]|uniref:uncharacterized protein n=1 Tax=Hypoxylon fragiforme TaxID=63214 RepID=UPI0020C6FB0C|nr:uncharacterized protein GGS25DRAFT_518486 [Hypoxylon fragiforme]KAI2612798.1 hypothetical protein GGS25DRAFT_518486 [Hypoxylon fragiforme]
MIRVKAPILQLLLAVTLLLHSAVARPPSPGRHAYHPIRSVAYKPWELAQFHLDPFQLTHMCIECKKNIWDSLLGCEIQFNWDDPNANQSCTCHSRWQWDGATRTQGPLNNYSTEYSACKVERGAAFQFKFIDLSELSNFGLELTHMYKDTENFPTPTVANMFAQTNVTLQVVERSNTSITYSSPSDCPVKANITGVTI